MAQRNLSIEEIEFRRRARRRLTGAVVLVLLVVIVVPWLLPGEAPPPSPEMVEIRIPAQEASGVIPKIVPAAPATPDAKGQGASEVPAAGPAAVDAKAPEVSSRAPTPSAAATQAAAPLAPSPGAAKAPAVSPAERYFVQFGAFGARKNAEQKQAELKAKGIATFTEVVSTPAGERIRVRSGPYATREAAEKIRLKAKPLDSKLVVDGKG